MYLGVYNACLGDKPLGEALDIIAGIGMTSVEINSGGFLPPIHLPVDELRASEDARQEYLGEFSSRGLTLTAFNCNGNPLFPREGFPHAQGPPRLDRAGGAARRQARGDHVRHPGGQPRWHATRCGTPCRGGARSSTCATTSGASPSRSGRTCRPARPTLDVKVAIEMHPGNIVFNPSTMHRLAEEIDSTHVGAEMDPSHLFWQWIDPVLAVKDLGSLVVNAAAKDTRINEAAKVNGVLDDRFTRIAEGEPGYLPLGGGTTLSGWPSNSSWDFVAVGRGHDVSWWTEFLRALRDIDPDMPVNIEHEDLELDQLEGLTFAANTLLEAEKAL